LPEIQYSFHIRDKKKEIDSSLNDSEFIFTKTNAKKSNNSFKADFAGVNLNADSLLTILYSNNPSKGNIFTTHSILGKNMIYIMDNEGIPVYLKLMPNRVINFKPYNWGICSYYDYKELAYKTLDKELNYLATYRMQNGYDTDMHEFLLLENGHSFLIAYDRVSMDMSTIVPEGQKDATVIGAVIQELDENKQVIFEWRTWDHFKITDSYSDLTALTIDYAHVNSIFADTDSSIIISSRFLNEITRINKKTGRMIWRLGGKNNQFRFMNDSRKFAGQHSVMIEKNGNITLFDNGLDLVPEYSRGIEYQVDVSDKKVWLVNEYLHDPLKYGNIMGNMQKLENGNVLIYWGGLNIGLNSYFSEYNTNKELTFEAEFNKNNLPSYRVYRELWEPAIFSLSHDSLLFDSTEIGNESIKQIVIKNISSIEQSITSANVNSPDYYVNEILPFSLLPGEEKTVSIAFAPKSPGNYQKSIVFCSETDSVLITKKISVNSKSSQITGIPLSIEKHFSVAPNPFYDSFQIFSSTEAKEIILYDLQGRICYKTIVNTKNENIKPVGLKNGVYILYIRFYDESGANMRIFKF